MRSKKILTILATLFLLILIPLTLSVVQKQQNISQKAKETEIPKDSVAKANNEFITKTELEKVKGFFSYIRGKEATDSAVREEALDFVINRRLLQKEAEKRGILSSVSKVANERFASTEKALQTDLVIYKTYLQYVAIKEALIPIATRFEVIDYLSIRYLYDDNASSSEKQYKEIVDKKIQEYYQQIQQGLDIREAIKKRCLDKEINSLPYDKSNKIYTTTFNGTSCREQAVNLRVSKDTNPLWGEVWLKLVFEKTKKNQLSPIITYTSKNVGMYFIIKVLDKGGEFFSLDELVASLRSTNNVRIYQQP